MNVNLSTEKTEIPRFLKENLYFPKLSKECGCIFWIDTWSFFLDLIMNVEALKDWPYTN